MMNMQQMLGESGRTMSNIDRDTMSNRQIRDILGESGRTISNMDRTIASGMGSPMMSDNEPRMEDRSPANQMFSIDTAIGNLMTEYDMVVRNIPFAETIEEKQMAEMRAQNVADQIDQLQQQKIGIQAQNVPQQDEISRILDSISI
jgi:hypothetical protein